MSTKTSFVGKNVNGFSKATGQIISAIDSFNRSSNQVIDGFVKGPHKLSQKPAQAGARKAAKSDQLHRRTEKTQTLARSGVRNPSGHFSSKLQKLNPGINIDRELRAKLTQRHSRVNRFGGSSKEGLFVSQPAAKSPRSKRQTVSMTAQKAVAAPLPSMITSVSHQKLERMLDEALVKADAHKAALRYQAARHFWQRRWMSGPRRWVVLLVFLLTLGTSLFIAWQRIPELSLKTAGLRAHLSPVSPSYRPEGYKMAGPATAVMGAVSIKYHSGSDDTSYIISQAHSSLTSAMLAHTIIPKGASVQTSQVEGNTIYIYGTDNDAAWVNNGVLYTIQDKAGLSSDELLKIVKGINP